MVEKMVSQVNILRRKELEPLVREGRTWESSAGASVCAHAGSWKVLDKADGVSEGRKPAMARPGHITATAGPQTGR